MVNVDQELDAIVKQTRAGRRRGGARGGGGRPRGGMRQSRSRSARRNSSFGRNGGFTGRRRSLSTSDLRGACKIMISNLDFGVSERDMKELFQDYGGVRKVNFHYDRNGRSLGSCEVVFDRSAMAQKARRQYHGVPLDGRPMEIEIVGVTQRSPPRRSRPSPRRPTGRVNSAPRRNGGGGGGPRREKKETLTAEELDKQLDQYLTAGATAAN